MEESSVQRRERLKAMRMEADESSSGTSTTLPPVHFSNPLLEPTTASLQEMSPAAQRFDFYTDPMAAFSGNKRRNIEQTHQQPPPNYFQPPPFNSSSHLSRPPSSLSAAPQTQQRHTPIGFTTSIMPYSSYTDTAGPRNLEMTPSPSPQFQSSYFPVQRMYEAPLPYHDSGSLRIPNPVGFPTPYPGHQGTPAGGTAGYGFPSHSPSVGPFPSPGFGQGNSPRPNLGRGSGQQFHNYPNPGRGRGSPRPELGRGSDQRFYNNPSLGPGRGSPRPFYGRGNDQRFNNNPSPGAGRGRGRGQGLHDCVSARERPECFYNKSMVEDPWRSLKPIVRSIDSTKSWLPKSISTKKAKVSESARKFTSQQSLAEYLAASLEEVTNNET